METFEHVTLMFSMPRSRSQWFRWFFSTGCEAWHDPLHDCRHPQELINKIVKWSKAHPGQRLVIVDTGAIFFYKFLTKHLPGMQLMFLFRALQSINDSIIRQLGRDGSDLVLEQQARTFHYAYGAGKAVRRLHYEALPAETLQRAYGEATGRAIEIATVEEMSRTNVDTPMRKQPKNSAATRQLLTHVERMPR